MKEMYLSPRGVYCEEEKAFQCCKQCVKVINTKIRPYQLNLPRFAIANGAVFGEAPSELTDLNDAELALVSLARTNKHVFSFYGGAHKSMRGWHNMYENNVDGIARTLNPKTSKCRTQISNREWNTLSCFLTSTKFHQQMGGTGLKPSSRKSYSIDWIQQLIRRSYRDPLKIV
jgi:hypothetical protein